MSMLETDDRLCRLVVTLAREDEGLYRNPEELIADARVLLRAGVETRAALTAGEKSAVAIKTAVEVAAIYKAQVVTGKALEGTVLGLRFSSGQYTRGGGVYHVA